jgi:hypothetical protein
VLVAWVMRSVLAAGRLPGTAARAARAVLGGVWLGLLSESRLRALDEEYYRRDGTYRTAAWNERGLWEWEHKAVVGGFTPGARVIVPACGGGREVLALLRAGFDAVGYESHPQLREFAAALLTQRGFPGRILPMARDRFPPAARGEGVLVGWGAYSLIAPQARRVEFLQAAAAAAGAGAVVLSGFAGAARGRELRLVASVAGGLRRLRRRPAVELGDTLAPNRVHVFTASELTLEIARAGLQTVRLEVVARAGDGVDYACAVARRTS